jgi:rfaE bifunctional protein nucleotidyltransferase chain/domain
MVFYNVTHLKDYLGTELAEKDIVLTCGCYDIFHLGHVSVLEFCAKLGDVVIVAVNGDSSVKEEKGADRPIQMAAYRANVVEACGYVDHVLVWESTDMIPVVHELEPRYFVKGNRKFEDVLETDAVMAHGGDVICFWNHLSASTTAIVGRIIAADHAKQNLEEMREEYKAAPHGTIGEPPYYPGKAIPTEPPPEYDVGADFADEGSRDQQVERVVEMPLLECPVTPHQLRVAAHCLETQMAAMEEEKVATFALGGVQFSFRKGGISDDAEDQNMGGTDGGPEEGETRTGEEAEGDIPF